MTKEERRKKQRYLIREQLRDWHPLLDINGKMHFHYLMENLDIYIGTKIIYYRKHTEDLPCARETSAS